MDYFIVYSPVYGIAVHRADSYNIIFGAQPSSSILLIQDIEQPALVPADADV